MNTTNWMLATLALGAAPCLVSPRGASTAQGSQAGEAPRQDPPTLEETRVTMDKWIETQQIISKERKDWQQGKEILVGRLELVKNEIALLQGKIREAQSSVVEANGKRDELLAQSQGLADTVAKLTEAVAGMELKLRPICKSLPDPIRTKLEPLIQRIPAEGAETRVSAAERYQNVLGILNELNRVNNEISVHYEVHELAGGKPAEVQAIYLGLAQAYYVSGGGEAGIGRPSPDGWKWAPSKSIAGDLLMALEILQNKQTPAFVSLPVTIQ